MLSLKYDNITLKLNYPNIKRPSIIIQRVFKYAPAANTIWPRTTNNAQMTVPKRIPKTLKTLKKKN